MILLKKNTNNFKNTIQCLIAILKRKQRVIKVRLYLHSNLIWGDGIINFVHITNNQVGPKIQQDYR